MKIAILLLCHEPAHQIARRLASPFYASADLKVYIHYDAVRKGPQLEALRQALEPLAAKGLQFELLEERMRCAWGEFSLVQATHLLMRAALADAAFSADYLLLQSSSCAPIRPLASLQAFLTERQGDDFIQCVDVGTQRWIQDGLEIERLQYYFPFNFRSRRAWFEAAVSLQRRWGVSRKLPPGLPVRFGSQWFALTRETAGQVSQSLDDPALSNFLRHCWIPDEFAIQSLVAKHQRPERIAGHNLTYYEFDHRGQPLVLDAGHLQHVLAQPFFFARKMQMAMNALAIELDQHVAEPEADLSYFARVGQPTGDYQRFLARARHSPKRRAAVGTQDRVDRGLLDKGRRSYFVLFGASRGYLLALTRAARAQSATPLPIFDLVFEPGPLVPAAEHASWWGISPEQTPVRDYDPEAFLFQLAHLGAGTPTVVALSGARASKLRDRILQDPNAVVMCADPEGLSRVQLAEASLRDINAHGDAALLDATYAALRNPVLPLPQDAIPSALREGKHQCRALQIQHVTEAHTEPTLRALRLAYEQVDVGLYYAPEHAARGRLFD